MSNEILNPVFTSRIPDLNQWELLDDFGGGRFEGVSWHELNDPRVFDIVVEGEKIEVTTIGLQRLDGTDSRVVEHEESQFELVFPFTDKRAVMEIRNKPGNIPVMHTLRGPFETMSELAGTEISVFLDGSIKVGETRIEPVITKAGQSHGTEGGPLVYLVIKGDLR